jgi:CRP/FNR family cyclic AMP-dependent transcriptional regulator
MNYRDFPLFAELDDKQLQALMDGCKEYTFAPGKLMIEEGSAGQEVFFVQTGQMRVFVKTKIGQQELAKIASPALVGEVEWLTGEKRLANVEAVTEVKALGLPFDALHTRLQDNCMAMLKVTYNIGKVVASRLSAINQRLAELQQGATTSPEMAQLKKKLFADWTL